MKLSARNVLKGKVVEVKKGAVNSEILLELSGIVEKPGDYPSLTSCKKEGPII